MAKQKFSYMVHYYGRRTVHWEGFAAVTFMKSKNPDTVPMLPSEAWAFQMMAAGEEIRLSNKLLAKNICKED